MMLQDKLRTTAVVAAAALAMMLGTAASFAQPGGASHGPHGHGASGDIGHLIEKAQAQLNLNTSQQQQFAAAVASTKAAHQTGATLHESVKTALTAELAKPEPDLAAVAAVSDNAQAQGQALRKSIRGQWLALYATFSPDQKAVVRQMLQDRMAKAESFRQKMQDRFNGRTGKSS